MFKMREVQNENDNLVLKILKIRGSSKGHAFQDSSSPMAMSSRKKKRFASIKRSSSVKSFGHRSEGSERKQNLKKNRISSRQGYFDDSNINAHTNIMHRSSGQGSIHRGGGSA